MAGSSGGNEAGLRAVVEAMLQSASFLYRTELGTLQGDAYPLTAWEIASEPETVTARAASACR